MAEGSTRSLMAVPLPVTRFGRLEGSLSGLLRKAPLALSALGYGLGLAGMALLIQDSGGYGYDSHAYWLAGRNVLEGQPLYWPHAEGALGAYRYPPIFAQLWAPFTLMPALAFSWLWRFICLLSLRFLAGSWRNVGLWLLFPFTISELSLANVTFPVAAMTVLALQGRASLAIWAGVLKLGPLLLLPYLWLTRPDTRRAIVMGVLAVVASFTVSFAVSPESWLLYAQSLLWLSGSSVESAFVISVTPSGTVDLLVRLAIAVGLVVLAVRWRSDRAAFTATVIAVPVLAAWRLAPLLVLPRLRGRRRTEEGRSSR